MLVTSRAAVLTDLRQPLQFQDLKIPTLKAGQVLVELAYSGLCRTQLMEINGEKGEDRFLPHTLGHEGSGVVAAIGPKVKKVKKGDRVVLSWIKGKGLDVPSTVYQGPEGPVNSGAVATFITVAVVSENRVVPIPKKMPLKEAALLGCAIPTGAGLLLNSTTLDKKGTVAVFGTGGIGLSAVMAARMRGARTIIAVDVVDDKLSQAKQLGATHTVNARQTDPVAEILKITQGRGVDAAVESAGRSEAMQAAHRSVRDQGGVCVIAGNLPKGQMISLDPFDLIKGKQIRGTWGGESKPDADIPGYVKMFFSGKLKLSLMANQIYGFSALNQALKDFSDGKVGRALIEINKSLESPR